MPLLKIVCTCNNIKERTWKTTCKWRWSDSLGVNPKCPLIIIGRSLRGHLHVCGQNWWAHQFVGGKSHDFSLIFCSHVLANLMLTKSRWTFSVICSSKYQFNFFRSKVHNAYAPTYCLAKAHILLEGNKTNVHLLKHKWASVYCFKKIGHWQDVLL